MTGRMKATLVMLNPLRGDEIQAALSVLGKAIDELDRAAHDAGFRLTLIVMPQEAPSERARRREARQGGD